MNEYRDTVASRLQATRLSGAAMAAVAAVLSLASSAVRAEAWWNSGTWCHQMTNGSGYTDCQESQRIAREKYNSSMSIFSGAEAAYQRELHRGEGAPKSGSAPVVIPEGPTPEEKFANFRRRAEAGDGHAQRIVADAYYIGLATSVDLAQAANWYRRSADSGDAEAAQNYALMRMNGLGGAADVDDAARYFARAAEKGQPLSQAVWGRMLIEGKGAARNVAEGLRFAKLAADQGNPVGLCTYAAQLERGEAVALDAPRAVEMFKRAESSNVCGDRGLAVIYRKGRPGVPQDLARARQYAQRGAELGDMDMQEMYGEMLRDGAGGGKDESAALAWMRRAAEQGQTGAFHNVGVALREGLGVKADAAAAAPWFLRAAQAGIAQSQYRYGRMLLEGEGIAGSPAEGIRWLNKAAEQNVAAAWTSLGYASWNGTGVSVDLTRAADYFVRGAELGDPEAMFRAGDFLIHEETPRKNPAVGLAWMKKAADNNFGAALAALSMFYFKGELVAQDEKRGLELLRRAADAGDPLGLAMLGRIYQAGAAGVTADPNRAMALYRRAIDAGNENAKQWLEEMQSRQGR